MIDWVVIRRGCPFWCLTCGFGINWEDWPGEKAEVLRRAGRSPEDYGT